MIILSASSKNDYKVTRRVISQQQNCFNLQYNFMININLISIKVANNIAIAIAKVVKINKLNCRWFLLETLENFKNRFYEIANIPHSTKTNFGYHLVMQTIYPFGL